MGLAAHMLDPRLLRFAVVGVLNTAFGYFVYAVMLWLGLSYAAAAAVGTVLGVLFNFKSTGRLVFGSSDNRLLIKFVGVYMIVYIANIFGLWIFIRSGINAYTAGFLTLLPAAILSFVLNKVFVFRSVP
jgi:putative flippase GtrA